MSFQLQNKYILPTPAGAYYCSASKEIEPSRQFLQRSMSADKTCQLDKDTLRYLAGNDIESQKLILLHMQKLKWLQEFDQLQQLTKGAIEDVFPDILKSLSSDAKALLADNQGFHLSSTGFTHEASEKLSALSGDLASLYSRHQGVIKGNLNIKSSAFAVVDAAGYSQLGFWPIYIGDLQFMLIVSGVPRFDQDAFVRLIWSLHKRYYINKISEVSDVA